jgi:hypothetical protein
MATKSIFLSKSNSDRLAPISLLVTRFTKLIKQEGTRFGLARS